MNPAPPRPSNAPSARARAALAALAIFALLLRLFDLGGNPAGFFRDEADKGYTSLCLLETGRDQTGALFPVFVRSLGVTTSSLYQYLDIPFVWLAGLNEWTVRLPAALAGAASVPAAFLLGRAWLGTPGGLWAALFVCLSPWSLLLSRWANQSILLTALVPMGVYFHARRGAARTSGAALAAVFLLLALYTYAPARLVIPLLALGLTIAAWPPGAARRDPAAFLRFNGVFWGLLALGALPLAHHLYYETADGAARFSAISIFRGQPFPELAGEWLRNHALHFSPGFLFVSGDANLRHNTGAFGQLHWYLAPVLLLGLWRAVRIRGPLERALLVWLALFPAAAACTNESLPHALRSAFGVPVFQILAAGGVAEFIERRGAWNARMGANLAKAAARLWLAALVLFPAIHLYDLYWRYPVYSAADWEYGHREAVGWWRENRRGDERTVVSGIAEYPYVFFLFYGNHPPRDWIETGEIPGVTFLPTGQPAEAFAETFSGPTLLLLRPGELPFYPAEHAIDLPSGEPWWRWVRINRSP